MTDRRDPHWDEQPPEVDTEQLLSEWFEEQAPVREPAVLAPNVIARTALTRRRARWFVADWWRDLLHLHQRPSLAPTVAVGAVVVLVLVLGASVLRLGGLFGEPEEARTLDIPAQAITVSPDDEAVTRTISDAIAAAKPGEQIYILPGEYSENLVIDKDVELIGAGPAEEIVLRPANDEEPIILIDGGDPRIEGFTISGSGTSVVIVASDPTLTGMVFDGVGDQRWTYTGGGWDGFDDAQPSIRAELFADPIIHDSTFVGGGEIRITSSSDATITDNTLLDGAAILLGSVGGETVVRGNTISDSGRYSIESTSCSALTIEENTITQTDPGVAISVRCLSGAILNNSIEGGNVGIQLLERSSPRIVGNTISTDGVALEIHEDVEPTLGDNELCGANAIMAVMRGAAPVDLSGNTRCDGAPLLFE